MNISMEEVVLVLVVVLCIVKCYGVVHMLARYGVARGEARENASCEDGTYYFTYK